MLYIHYDKYERKRELKLAYVKFLQGSLARYQALPTKDANTLYFVFDNEQNPTTSALYLGERLVSGIGEGFGASTLNELSDVVLEAVADRDILMFNGTEWENISFDELVSEVAGKHIDVDTNAFELGEDDILKLAGLAEAEPGAQLVKGEDGKLTWVKPEVAVEDLKEEVKDVVSDVADLATNVQNLGTARSETATKVSTLETNLNNVSTDLAKKANAAEVYTKNEVDTKIAMVDHMKRKVVNSLADIDLAAADALYYIYMVPTGSLIEDDKYDEYLVIDDHGTRKVERVGSWEVNLSDYATKEEVNKKADAVEGHSLVADTEIARLAKVNENAEVNVVNGVESEEFILTDRTLGLKAVPANKISGLENNSVIQALNNTIAATNTNVNNIITTLNNYVTKTEYTELATEVADLRDILTWKPI